MTWLQNIPQTLHINYIQPGSSTLITGPPGIGKTIFCRNIAAECSKAGTGVVYVTLDSAPKDIEEAIHTQDDSKGTLNKLSFVDCYSWLVGEMKGPSCISHLSNLGDLSVKLFTALQEKGPQSTVIFDSISTLFVYNVENEVIRFLQVNIARIRHMGCFGIWTVEEGIHTPALYNTLRHMMDVTLELRFEETAAMERRLRVHTCKGSIHSTQWFPFEIKDKGILVIENGDPKAEAQ
ncbi:RAD55 family ATPase [Candidatus Bathyarchaeota archaeon]|nr:RAD55 family ATPase [Candidatus Bathyarchaeota archaeon]